MCVSAQRVQSISTRRVAVRAPVPVSCVVQPKSSRKAAAAPKKEVNLNSSLAPSECQSPARLCVVCGGSGHSHLIAFRGQ
jgi:hypothetical protein